MALKRAPIWIGTHSDPIRTIPIHSDICIRANANHSEPIRKTYYMSKFFEKILRKSLPSPNSQVKNSFIFKDIISKTKIPTDHIMISLDVSSLLTNVPFDLVINSIKKRWSFIKSATNLPLEDFQKGIEFLMNNTFFQFDNKYY